MSTFVSVGNATQPFQRLINLVIEYSEQLPQPVIIQHGNTSVKDKGKTICVPFMDMNEFSHRIKEADLLILHAGAGSLIHAMQYGKTPLVMARQKKFNEHIDDHQLELAQALAKQNKVVLLGKANDFISAKDKALALQSQKVELKQDLPILLSMVQKTLEKYSCDIGG